MPRKPRVISSTNIYHVVIRGADRQRIFEEPRDYQKYINLLEYYKSDLNFKIYAYCLMPNHVHILIFTPEVPLGDIFRRINTSYAVWFNMKYSRTGFVQQGRYYSEPIESERYLLTAIRYIHQNPFKAGLEKYPGESYVWNSITDYANSNSNLVDIDFAINVMGSKMAFTQFQFENSDDEFLDLEKMTTRLPDDVAKEIIASETNCYSVTDFQNLSMIDRDKNLFLLSQKGISIRQLNRLTGTPRGVIARIIKKHSKL